MSLPILARAIVIAQISAALAACATLQPQSGEVSPATSPAVLEPIRVHILVDDRLMRVDTPHAIAATRRALIRYLWGREGFPARRLPDRTLNVPSPVSSVPNLSRVDELRVPMEAGESGLAYHFIPKNASGRLVILHHGHGTSFNDAPGDPPGNEVTSGLSRTIRELLQRRYAVLAIFMVRSTPWDRRASTHDEMFSIRVSSGHPMKFFLEPTAVCLNYLKRMASQNGFPAYRDFNMVGLSGGGWATSVYAAIDPTISMSFPVSGSLPLYLRFGGSIGDREQTDTGLYRIAGYPDLYVLGSYGAGRHQVQILNRRDSCCFGEAQHDAQKGGKSFDTAIREYEGEVRRLLQSLGAGDFRVVIDEAATGHMISRYALTEVILQQLEGKDVAAAR